MDKERIQEQKDVTNLFRHKFFKNDVSDESFSLCCERLLFKLKDLVHPVVGVFSCERQEGNTGIVLKLAQMAVRNLNRVLVVDAGSRGYLSFLMNLSGEKGLCNIGPDGTGGTVHNTHLKGLSVIPCGENDEFVDVHLVLKEMLTREKSRWDMILIDLPPILDSLLAAKLSRDSMDGLVWVIAANKTRKETIARARAELEQYGDPNILGTILNRQEYFIPKFLYRFC